MADWAGIAWKSEKPLAATRVAVSTKRKRAAQSDASRKRSPSPLVVRPALRLRLGSRSAESNAEASALLNAVAAEREYEVAVRTDRSDVAAHRALAATRRGIRHAAPPETRSAKEKMRAAARIAAHVVVLAKPACASSSESQATYLRRR